MYFILLFVFYIMWNSFKSKYKHLFSHINRRAKSGQKTKNAMDRCILVLKKVEKNNGYDLRCTKTMRDVLMRFKKYRISTPMLTTRLEAKWLTDLAKWYNS